MKRIPLCEKVADKLRSHIRDHQQQTLPSSRNLAKFFSVSLVTMVKALALLRDEGLLEFERGSKIRISGAPLEKQTPKTRKSQAEHLADAISGRISSGEFRLHTPLPKGQHFVVQEHVSNATVCVAMKILNRKELIYKQGQRWWVGPSEKRTVILPSFAPPVILVIQKDEFTWRDMMVAKTTARFLHAFKREAEETGVLLQPVFTDLVNQYGTVETLPIGLDSTLRSIAKLGNRYIGALILSLPQKDPLRWVKSLVAQKRFVAWFDYANQPLPEPFQARTFFRYSLDRSEADLLMLRILSNLGHKKIGAACYSNSTWMPRRNANLRELAERVEGKPTVLTSPMPPAFWENRSDRRSPYEVLLRHNKSGLPFVRKMITEMLRNHPKIAVDPQLHSPVSHWKALASIPLFERYVLWNSQSIVPLLKQGCTAIIGPDDSYAQGAYFWFCAAGIKLPVHLSFVTTDPIENPGPGYDTYRLGALPVSSVEFNTADQGYCAFHVIFGDMPHLRKKPGIIRPSGNFVQRGSVGQVPCKPLEMSFEGVLW